MGVLPYSADALLPIYRRRKERLHRRYMLQNQPETAVPRLQPITHREGSATLAPALQVWCMPQGSISHIVLR